jgi:hypothetical protein
MISGQRRCLALLLIVSVLFALSTGAEATTELASELVNRIKAQQFNRAAAMFHYPSSQSPAERDADRAAVAKWIETLSEQLGGLQSFTARQSSTTEKVLSLSIAGGDVSYWASRGALQTVAHGFNASWKNERDTRVTIHVMTDQQGWVVQSLHCGVLDSRPDAQQFMMSLARRLVPQVR